ncbi:GATA transcription factor 19 [Triticum urartu]|uniref:GATA transcription factor 19 n=1 Tax=Triticum urartu TaxID=4572 RepID=M7ZQP6_TRIUA|nr:GATA transcription factor 19 [Triticum urartu]
MATSTFSLFFPPLPSSKGQWPSVEEAAYSYDDHSSVTTLSPSSPASSASSGSLVDCTLSLGTPSTRRPEPDRTRHGAPPQACPSVSAGAEPCYYHQQQGRGGAAGHEQLLDRRCANCGTASTPLWRNGPRGPKSLCNACGIRFNPFATVRDHDGGEQDLRRASDEKDVDNGGGTDNDFDVEEWRRIFPDSDDDVTGPDPMDDGISRAEWLAHRRDEKDVDNGGGTDNDFDVEEWRRIFPDSDDDVTGPDPMDDGISRAEWLALTKSD